MRSGAVGLASSVATRAAPSVLSGRSSRRCAGALSSPSRDQADGPIEAALGVPPEVGPSDLIGIRTEPAHTEAYTTITKRQWDYPAILAAYDAVACSPEATARPGSSLSCREVYVAEPESVGEDEPICDIAYPLGELQEDL